MIISAQEAKEKLEHINKTDTSILDEIMNRIEKAINRHDNYIYYNGYLPQYVIKQLIELGYIVGDEEKGDRPFDSNYRKISF